MRLAIRVDNMQKEKKKKVTVLEAIITPLKFNEGSLETAIPTQKRLKSDVNEISRLTETRQSLWSLEIFKSATFRLPVALLQNELYK